MSDSLGRTEEGPFFVSRLAQPSIGGQCANYPTEWRMFQQEALNVKVIAGVVVSVGDRPQTGDEGSFGAGI